MPGAQDPTNSVTLAKKPTGKRAGSLLLVCGADAYLFGAVGALAVAVCLCEGAQPLNQPVLLGFGRHRLLPWSAPLPSTLPRGVLPFDFERRFGTLGDRSVEPRGHEGRMAKETVQAVAFPAIATWGESETERAWKEIKGRRPQPESVIDAGKERQCSNETSLRARPRFRDRCETCCRELFQVSSRYGERQRGQAWAQRGQPAAQQGNLSSADRPVGCAA